MKDNLYVAGTHTALDILRFAVFFFSMTCYSIFMFQPKMFGIDRQILVKKNLHRTKVEPTYPSVHGPCRTVLFNLDKARSSHIKISDVLESDNTSVNHSNMILVEYKLEIYTKYLIDPNYRMLLLHSSALLCHFCSFHLWSLVTSSDKCQGQCSIQYLILSKVVFQRCIVPN